ncbi:carboxymuconolactone decarboxylase family protein [Rhizobium sp.]
MSNRPRSQRFERGLKTRREVLGPEYVDKAIDGADDFNWAMQELTTEWCWDATWNRPGLDRRSRSILNLGMIAALGRSHEFKLHVRGAINNGITRDELKEIFIQVGTYCGVPAAMDCFRVAKEVFAEMDGALDG